MLSDHVYLMKGSRAYYTNVVYMFTSSLPLLFCLGYEEDGDGVGALDLEQGSESSWPSPTNAPLHPSTDPHFDPGIRKRIPPGELLVMVECDHWSTVGNPKDFNFEFLKSMRTFKSSVLL